MARSSNSTAATRKRVLEAAREHTGTIGEVVYAANYLHDGFFRIFLMALILGRGDFTEDPTENVFAEAAFHHHALELWHVVQSDKAQREMALSAISTVPSRLKLKTTIKALSWAKKMTEDLALYRNLLAHTTVMFTVELKGKEVAVVPQFGSESSRPAHKKRLRLADDMKFWKAIRNDLMHLGFYMHQIYLFIRGRELARLNIEDLQAGKTLPARPKLRSVTRLQEINRTLGLEAQSTKQRSRKRASPK